VLPSCTIPKLKRLWVCTTADYHEFIRLVTGSDMANYFEANLNEYAGTIHHSSRYSEPLPSSFRRTGIRAENMQRHQIVQSCRYSAEREPGAYRN